MTLKIAHERPVKSLCSLVAPSTTMDGLHTKTFEAECGARRANEFDPRAEVNVEVRLLPSRGDFVFVGAVFKLAVFDEHRPRLFTSHIVLDELPSVTNIEAGTLRESECWRGPMAHYSDQSLEQLWKQKCAELSLAAADLVQKGQRLSDDELRSQVEALLDEQVKTLATAAAEAVKAYKV